MARRSDDELILFFYGEHETPQEIEREMASDPDLARRYERLRREMSALDGIGTPEPRPGLEARMWARVAPELSRRSRLAWPPSGVFAWASVVSAVGVIALAAFLAGRAMRPPDSEQTVARTITALPPEARERILQAALADHLESSQRLLVEMANGSPADDERTRATDLLSANRMYRRAAERSGDRRVAAVLGELETLLTELADASGDSAHRTPQARAASEDLLFKVRVARNNLKETS